MDGAEEDKMPSMDGLATWIQGATHWNLRAMTREIGHAPAPTLSNGIEDVMR